MKVTFDRGTTFYNRLREEIENYFASNNISKFGNAALYWKSIILLSAWAAGYVWLVFFTPVWYIALPVCALYGINLAFIGFNIMHDGCHGSYSANPRLNYIMGMSMNLLGSNAFIWKTKHNTVHHTYTNIDGVDDDIMKVPLFRWCESQPKKPLHKFQHIYGFLLYAVSTLFWVFVTDFNKYFKKSVGPVPLPNISTQEHVIFWLTKVYYIGFYMVLPIMFVGFSNWLIGYLVVNALFGLTMSLVFQLAHVVENTHFYDANNPNVEATIQEEWAVQQMKTTSNFATNSKFWAWCLGGLNFQVEHHLFARVSHVHYPALNKILVRVSKEMNVTYNDYPTFRSALMSHLRLVKKLGYQEKLN